MRKIIFVVLLIVVSMFLLGNSGCGDCDVAGNCGESAIGKRVDDAASHLKDLVPESAPGVIGTGNGTLSLGDGLGLADRLFGDD